MPEGPKAPAGSRTGYLGLGSNVGDRLANLRAARDALAAHGAPAVASSPVYETEPVGAVADQRDFLNACVRVETALGPEELLGECKAIERELGREEGGVRHGPRPIDVDLLLLGGLEHRSKALTVPHPDILRRRFVLAPLLELDPGLTLPDGRALASFLQSVAGQQAEAVGAL